MSSRRFKGEPSILKRPTCVACRDDVVEVTRKGRPPRMGKVDRCIGDFIMVELVCDKFPINGVRWHKEGDDKYFMKGKWFHSSRVKVLYRSVSSNSICLWKGRFVRVFSSSRDYLFNSFRVQLVWDREELGFTGKEIMRRVVDVVRFGGSKERTVPAEWVYVDVDDPVFDVGDRVMVGQVVYGRIVCFSYTGAPSVLLEDNGVRVNYQLGDLSRVYKNEVGALLNNEPTLEEVECSQGL